MTERDRPRRSIAALGLWPLRPLAAFGRAVGRLGLRAVAMIIATMALLNVAILVAAGEIGRDARSDMLAPPIVRQAAGAADLMDRLGPEERRAALGALNSPMVRVDLIDDFRRTPAIDNPAPVFVPVIETYAAVLGDRPFSVYARNYEAIERRLISRARLIDDLIVVMRLADGSGLVLEAGAAFQRRITQAVLAYVTGVVGLVLIGLMIWASLSYARPLARLAEASAQVSDQIDGPPLPERGPKPVRDLAAALNAMRARLAGLMAERTTTLAAIAHDMRTYLTRLRMRAEFIDDPAQRDKAIADLSDMARLLEDALSLGRDAAEPPALETIALHAFLEAFAERRAETAEGRLSWTLSPETSAPARLAPADLTRALDNLVDNALRYGGGAEIGLVVDAAAAEISVRDRGPGVPEAFLRRMTEPFARLESSRSRETGGAGLGLAIAKARVERSGGALRLSNHPEGGLLAVIRLPLAVDQGAAPS